MAKKDEQTTGLALDFKQVDVVDEIMGIIYGIVAWVTEIIMVVINIAIGLVNWALALAGL
ncbi:MAG: hypothetical protein ACON4P_08105 [Candidatus Puniceispirillales bacterium]